MPFIKTVGELGANRQLKYLKYLTAFTLTSENIFTQILFSLTVESYLDSQVWRSMSPSS